MKNTISAKLLFLITAMVLSVTSAAENYEVRGVCHEGIYERHDDLINGKPYYRATITCESGGGGEGGGGGGGKQSEEWAMGWNSSESQWQIGKEESIGHITAFYIHKTSTGETPPEKGWYQIGGGEGGGGGKNESAPRPELAVFPEGQKMLHVFDDEMPHFTTTEGTPSAGLSHYFQLNSWNLTDDIIITPPNGFEISSDHFNTSTTEPLTFDKNKLNIVYVGLTGETPGEFSDNVTIESEGAETKNVAVEGTVTAVQEYQITFDAAGGEGGEVQNVAEGVVPTPPTVTRAGYMFMSWTPEIVAATADATYTAQWTITPYNKDTGVAYTTIQAVIDETNTLQGHTIVVPSGTYEGFTDSKGVKLDLGSSPGLCYRHLYDRDQYHHLHH